MIYYVSNLTQYVTCIYTVMYAAAFYHVA